MKIPVLNGSPRREKSDVMHITRAFLEGTCEPALLAGIRTPTIPEEQYAAIVNAGV